MRFCDSDVYSGRQPPAHAHTVRIRYKTASATNIATDDGYLMHYGILGQKWGIRRYQNEDGSLTEAGKKRYGTDTVPETETWMKKDAERLSDDELNRRINRLQRERQYKELTTQEVEKETRQFKKDLLRKGLLLPIGALVAVAGKKYIGKATSFIGHMANKKVIAPFRAAGIIKEIAGKGIINKLDDVGDGFIPFIVGKAFKS